MEKSVQLKENIFANGFNILFDLIKNMINLMDRKSYTEEDKVIQTYTRSLPMDLSSLADSISKLNGVVSNRTLMTQLDFVSDPLLEEEQMRVEREAEAEWQMKFMDMYNEHAPVDNSEVEGVKKPTNKVGGADDRKE